MNQKTILLLLPSLLFLMPFAFSQRDLTLLPGEKNLNVSDYRDFTDSSGNSSSIIAKNDKSEIVFDYTLHKFQPTIGKDPYAALMITMTEHDSRDSFVDISPYEYMDVDIVTAKGNSFTIYLKTFIDGYTNLGNFRTYHFESYEAQVHLGSKRYRLALKDFRPPDWWWKEVVPKAQTMLPREPDYTKLFGIDIKSGSSAQVDVPDRFTITKISFTKDRTGIAALSFGGFFIYLLTLFFILRFFHKRKGSPRSELSYQQLNISNHSDEESERLMKYIGTHFQEPELTVEQVGRETGILPTRIPVILQQKCTMAFKQYLNDIRIAEAKRLLRETDRTITEIAFAVGYNNVTHFNRVFRQVTSSSPTTYRENPKI